MVGGPGEQCADNTSVTALPTWEALVGSALSWEVPARGGAWQLSGRTLRAQLASDGQLMARPATRVPSGVSDSPKSTQMSPLLFSGSYFQVDTLHFI